MMIHVVKCPSKDCKRSVMVDGDGRKPIPLTSCPSGHLLPRDMGPELERTRLRERELWESVGGWGAWETEHTEESLLELRNRSEEELGQDSWFAAWVCKKLSILLLPAPWQNLTPFLKAISSDRTVWLDCVEDYEKRFEDIALRLYRHSLDEVALLVILRGSYQRMWLLHLALRLVDHTRAKRLWLNGGAYMQLMCGKCTWVFKFLNFKDMREQFGDPYPVKPMVLVGDDPSRAPLA
jgi:hypothetical protein